MEWLTPTHVFDWRKGKIAYLERTIQANLNKISDAIRVLQSWAKENNLKPSETAYVLKTGAYKRNLRFTKTGDENLEKAYRTHYISPLLSEKRRAKLEEKLSKPGDIVVYMIVRDTKCSRCLKDIHKGELLFMDADKPLCLPCAKLGHLIYLPAGDAKLSRLAKKYSELRAVVVKFSRARKRYERQGLLIQESALKKAEEDCK